MFDPRAVKQMKVDWKTLGISTLAFLLIAFLIQVPIRSLFQEHLISSGVIVEEKAKYAFRLWSGLAVLFALFIYQIFIAKKIWEPIFGAAIACALTGANFVGIFLLGWLSCGLAYCFRWTWAFVRVYLVGTKTKNETA